MASDREVRRVARAARIAARRVRTQARRERVQARREARAAGRPLPPGLRQQEYLATEIGTPREQVALTFPGGRGPENIQFQKINAVESSWVSHVMLIADGTTGQTFLGVRFLDGYACVYLPSSQADYNAMMAAPSKGKHVWAHWYGIGKRKITAETNRRLAGI